MNWRTWAALLVLVFLLPSSVQATHQKPIRHYLPPLWVTGYDLTGHTFSGRLAGPGICAADRNYIPQGARVHVPGVGSCLVADIGVVGWALDVWFPTAAQCYRIPGEYKGGYYT